MGTKTNISIEELLPFFSAKKLQKTTNGATDSVYFLDDIYVLKLFEHANRSALEEELKLLNLCNELPICKIIKKPFVLKNKECMIYEKAKGESLRKRDLNSLKQITQFLKKFHNKTKNKTSTNPVLFEKENIDKLIKQVDDSKLKELYSSINITLKNDGIIHADLFFDNALFYENKLSCVFDFINSCNGDFIFDLAIVALSWCNNLKEVEYLLKEYKTKISSKEFYEYIKYAALCFSIFRFFNNRDYNNLLFKLKKLN